MCKSVCILKRLRDQWLDSQICCFSLVYSMMGGETNVSAFQVYGARKINYILLKITKSGYKYWITSKNTDFNLKKFFFFICYANLTLTKTRVTSMYIEWSVSQYCQILHTVLSETILNRIISDAENSEKAFTMEWREIQVLDCVSRRLCCVRLFLLRWS